MEHVVESRWHWSSVASWLLAGAGGSLLVALIVAAAGPGIRRDRGPDVAGQATDVALERLERALERGDGRAAERAWHDAHVSTIRGGWRARVAVGDAALRLGDAGSDQRRAPARARERYLSALFVARAERSSEGAIRVAEAFTALGDTEPAVQSLRIADALGLPGDTGLRGRREALRARLSGAPALTTGTPTPGSP